MSLWVRLLVCYGITKYRARRGPQQNERIFFYLLMSDLTCSRMRGLAAPATNASLLCREGSWIKQFDKNRLRRSSSSCTETCSPVTISHLKYAPAGKFSQASLYPAIRTRYAGGSSTDAFSTATTMEDVVLVYKRVTMSPSVLLSPTKEHMVLSPVMPTTFVPP